MRWIHTILIIIVFPAVDGNIEHAVEVRRVDDHYLPSMIFDRYSVGQPLVELLNRLWGAAILLPLPVSVQKYKPWLLSTQHVKQKQRKPKKKIKIKIKIKKNKPEKQ